MGKLPIEQTPRFREGMHLLPRNIQDIVFQTLEFYVSDQHNPILSNHFLREKDTRIRSIFVEGDLRIILRDRGDGSILLLDVGDHARVYS